MGSHGRRQPLGSNADTHGYSKSDAQDYAYTATPSDPGAASCSQTHTYSEPEPNPYPDCNSHTNRDGHGFGDCHADRDIYTNSHGDGDT